MPMARTMLPPWFQKIMVAQAFLFFWQYIANDNGKLTFQNSTMVDDRPELNALSIGGGEIFLDAVIHGTDDPMCCPTLRTTPALPFDGRSIGHG